MPILPNRYKIGTEYRVEDIFITSEPIKAALNIKAGNVYTKNSSGYIIEVPHTGTTTVVADLRYGIFYAIGDNENGKGDRADGTTDGKRLGQFAQPTSFVIMKADANISAGNRVLLKTQNRSGTSGQPGYVADDVIADTVEACPAVTSSAFLPNTYLGRVLEVLTTRSRTDRRGKVQTAAGDLVAVRLGVF